MTAFQKGDRVKSNNSVQGMEKGKIYTIIKIVEDNTRFGNFVTYIITDERGNNLSITNGHMLLSKEG